MCHQAIKVGPTAGGCVDPWAASTPGDRVFIDFEPNFSVLGPGNGPKGCAPRFPSNPRSQFLEIFHMAPKTGRDPCILLSMHPTALWAPWARWGLMGPMGHMGPMGPHGPHGQPQPKRHCRTACCFCESSRRGINGLETCGALWAQHTR